MKSAYSLAFLVAILFAAASGQPIGAKSGCAVASPKGTTTTYPTPSQTLTYPKTSTLYKVQYKVKDGGWTDAPVYISQYGATNASPYTSYSNYAANTSMSFVSIPVDSNAKVQLRVTVLWDIPGINDHWSVRPSVKAVNVEAANPRTVLLSTQTGKDFDGDQFLLWWERAGDSAAVESLVFFLDPPYPPPGGKVITVTKAEQLDNLTQYDTVVFKGQVALGKAGQPEPQGAQSFVVPPNITTIFFAPRSWVQGKLRFEQNSVTGKRRIYGPGVLDGSLFEYDLRICTIKDYEDEGYQAISVAEHKVTDSFTVDGLVLTDHNRATNDVISNSKVNNVKTLGWNGNDDGLRLGAGTTASNVFVRSGDDSLMMWGDHIHVTNATVWQNYNGGVVNLGWLNLWKGDGNTIDGLYIVKTDWHSPPKTDPPDWTFKGLASQNNGIFVSMMVPGTDYGKKEPATFRNIFLDDPHPWVLFSLKILPPDCALLGLKNCPDVNLKKDSVLKLNMENFFPQPSKVDNLIGFESLPPGFALHDQEFKDGYTLTGTMDIGFKNVIFTLPDGTMKPLTQATAGTFGQVHTSGPNVHVTYQLDPNVYLGPGQNKSVKCQEALCTGNVKF
jgi:hypothetical protein